MRASSQCTCCSLIQAPRTCRSVLAAMHDLNGPLNCLKPEGTLILVGARQFFEGAFLVGQDELMGAELLRVILTFGVSGSRP